MPESIQVDLFLKPSFTETRSLDEVRGRSWSSPERWVEAAFGLFVVLQMIFQREACRDPAMGPNVDD